MTSSRREEMKKRASRSFLIGWNFAGCVRIANPEILYGKTLWRNLRKVIGSQQGILDFGY